MRRLAIALLALAALAAGCGGGDEASAEDTVKEFVKAVSDRDADKVCDDLVTKEFIEGATLQTGDSAKDACKQQFKSLQRSDFRLVKIDSTKVDGDKARVRATLEVQKQPQPNEFQLEKVDGDWRLTGGSGG